MDDKEEEEAGEVVDDKEEEEDFLNDRFFVTAARSSVPANKLPWLPDQENSQ